MGKVLISFLGAAQKERQYISANYKFKDGTIIKSPFIAKALAKYYHIDRFILIGTAHSMWEEVYKDMGDKDYDEDKYLDLWEKCLKSNHSNTNLTHEDVSHIENKIGNGSKIIIIKYGLNNDEIAENTKLILNIKKYLSQGDTLYLDITHAFRSLPIYLMNCLIYLKNDRNLKIEIESISYGMLDVSKEYPKDESINIDSKNPDDFITPVVELKKLLDIQEWISGAYSFSEFGNAYKIISLLEKESDNKYEKVIKSLQKFSDMKNLNYISNERTQIQDLLLLKDPKNLPEFAQITICPIMKDYFMEISNDIDYSRFQFRMAKWHYSHHNYGFALMLLVEACVTFCCEISGLETNDFNNRKKIKKTLSPSKEEKVNLDYKRNYNELKFYFDKRGLSLEDFLHYKHKSKGEIGFKAQNRNRNDIAHTDLSGKHYGDILKTLDLGLKFFIKYLDS